MPALDSYYPQAPQRPRLPVHVPASHEVKLPGAHLASDRPHLTTFPPSKQHGQLNSSHAGPRGSAPGAQLQLDPATARRRGQEPGRHRRRPDGSRHRPRRRAEGPGPRDAHRHLRQGPRQGHRLCREAAGQGRVQVAHHAGAGRRRALPAHAEHQDGGPCRRRLRHRGRPRDPPAQVRHLPQPRRRLRQACHPRHQHLVHLHHPHRRRHHLGPDRHLGLVPRRLHPLHEPRPRPEGRRDHQRPADQQGHARHRRRLLQAPRQGHLGLGRLPRLPRQPHPHALHQRGRHLPRDGRRRPRLHRRHHEERHQRPHGPPPARRLHRPRHLPLHHEGPPQRDGRLQVPPQRPARQDGRRRLARQEERQGLLRLLSDEVDRKCNL